MNCCSECFTSEYLKGIIKSSRITGDCDYCCSENVSIINPNALLYFFQNIFDLYKVDSIIGSSIEIQIDNDFKGKIFSQINNKKKELLREIISDDYKKYKRLFSGRVLLKLTHNNLQSKQVMPLQISWEKFAEEIISTNRFHIKNTLDLDKLEKLLKRYEHKIYIGAKYYRARISVDKSGYSKKDMRNPPPDRAKAGRANPLGISYLYLSNELSTTLYEARASLYDYVTVGEFRLTDDIRVINLRGDTYDPIYLAEQGELEDYLIHLPFISKLEQELSKPRRRSDNELDYLPTQYLSEFIKSIGFDGVEYQSSLLQNGFNYAIFNPNKLKCTSVAVYEICNIDLTHKKITHQNN